MPSFRIVVVEHTESPKSGSIVEKVGVYNPKSKERVLDAERIKYWMSVGAKPSATVHNMLISLGIIKGKKINVLPSYKKASEQKAVNSEQENAVVAPVAETQAEEAKADAPAEVPAPSSA